LAKIWYDSKKAQKTTLEKLIKLKYQLKKEKLNVSISTISLKDSIITKEIERNRW
jgi:hypothetical protein